MPEGKGVKTRNRALRAMQEGNWRSGYDYRKGPKESYRIQYSPSEKTLMVKRGYMKGKWYSFTPVDNIPGSGEVKFVRVNWDKDDFFSFSRQYGAPLGTIDDITAPWQSILTEDPTGKLSQHYDAALIESRSRRSRKQEAADHEFYRASYSPDTMELYIKRGNPSSGSSRFNPTDNIPGSGEVRFVKIRWSEDDFIDFAKEFGRTGQLDVDSSTWTATLSQDPTDELAGVFDATAIVDPPKKRRSLFSRRKESVDKGEIRQKLNAYAKSAKHQMAGKFTDADIEEVAHAVSGGKDVDDAVKSYLGLEDFEEASKSRRSRKALREEGGYFGRNYYDSVRDVKNDMKKGWFGRATAEEICEKFGWDTDWLYPEDEDEDEDY